MKKGIQIGVLLGSLIFAATAFSQIASVCCAYHPKNADGVGYNKHQYAYYRIIYNTKDPACVRAVTPADNFDHMKLKLPGVICGSAGAAPALAVHCEGLPVQVSKKCPVQLQIAG